MVTRRFIAGAVCPACGAVDKLVLLVGSPQGERECVSCGYSDKLADGAPDQELATRVNQPRPGEKPLSHEDDVQTLDLLDPRKPTD